MKNWSIPTTKFLLDPNFPTNLQYFREHLMQLDQILLSDQNFQFHLRPLNFGRIVQIAKEPLGLLELS